MDKELICLDTSILIDFYRKHNKSNSRFARLSQRYRLAVSVITKLEILVGVRPEQRTFWEKVFSKLQILPLNEREVEIAADIIQTLTRKNKIIGLKDILIAATARSHNLKIATLNLKDFERVDNLIILH